MDEQQNEQLVLTAEERAGCIRVAAGEGPHSQRAQAVLALADGATMTEAAAQTGLTENQVKHWYGRFRHGRLAIFPEELLVVETAVTTATLDPGLIAVELLPQIVPAKQKKEKKAKKDKKKNKKKDNDKKKKDKGKKDKKGKKNKDKKGKSKKK
ncbi:MAG: helix-turn-helix domain-containing protein [Chloroflexi bacterium]|nr:helix-turn-helix domain-containing protein [Ardenticatenaceae bacterium]MBL1127507.1 helix-turn-helix domain-containing protein [Chloroflexota bacterium]NOG33570.1 helix-turn-helix domain-containing protein [Chloroflexota bacterium]GIK56525.1 MAG: hypothetical protein BroJett015_21880 [Chloroflexota bacterium]